MLKGKLYKVNAIELLPQDLGLPGVQKYIVSLSLDGSHDIFKGHFPGNPVLPGVCQVEMVREVSGEITDKQLMLMQASQVKYLALINPLANDRLSMNLKFMNAGQGEIDVTAEITSGETIFMKMKGRLTEF
ncbi:MAG: 3-hydroxyacyl-ACP dehydratase [Bacteroidetes bacterium]|nr:3-hydroxyacyl-ACP dehydratase [Bacteroidota bacterium]